MKKILFCVIIFFNIIQTEAQDITTMWPYAYSDFQVGKVYFKNKQALSAPLNIHLLKSTLHYIDRGVIKEALTSEVVFVEVNSDMYFMRNNQMLRVLVGDSTGFVAELLMADFNTAIESSGAYGSSSNVQATRKLSSLEVGGINITNHMELKSKKDAGSLLTLSKKYFIVTKNNVYLASKKAIESELSEQKRVDFNIFLKQQKVNWKKPESLIAVINFLKD